MENNKLKIGEQCPHALDENGKENEECPVACVEPWCGDVNDDCVRVPEGEGINADR